MKIRPTTAEEEAEFEAEDVQQRLLDGDVKQGDPQALAEHILSGKEVVLSEQVREFIKAQGMTEDEFIAHLLKTGNRMQ